MHLFVTYWFTLFVAAKLTQVNRKPNKVSLSAALVNWEEMQKDLAGHRHWPFLKMPLYGRNQYIGYSNM